MIRLTAVAAAMIALLSAQPGLRAETTTPVSSSNETTTMSSDQHPALVPVSKKGKFHSLHRSFLKRGKEGPIDVLFLGDSITERWTSFPQVWDKHYGKLNAANFGIGGDRTQHVLWRIDQGELDGISPKVLVMMIGTNNSNTDEPEPIIRGIKKIIGQIQDKLPKTKILLLGIFPREAKRNLPDNVPYQRVQAVNKEIQKLDDGKTIRYLDIGDKLTVDGKVSPEIMPDGVHLSMKGYEAWAEAMDPLLNEMLGKKK